jgi:hypothetical protein
LENFKYYDDDRFFEVRLYQLPMIDFGYMLFQDEESDREFTQKLVEAGTRYCYCGRGIGKTVFIVLDLLLDTVYHYRNWSVGVSSFNDDKVNDLLAPYEQALQYHPFMKIFLGNTKDIDSKDMKIETGYGHIVRGVSMALTSKSPGSNWESLHLQKQIVDEQQKENDEILFRRSQSKAELGCIEYFAGITAFSDEDPAGKIFNDPEKAAFLVNLPKTVSPSWIADNKNSAIKEYNGSEEPAYKIHILAQVVKNLRGLWNMEKIMAIMKRPNGTYRPEIKHFEISEKEYDIFESVLVMEKPASSTGVFIAADFGSTVTEICLFFLYQDERLTNYKYEYNITLHRLIPDQQKKIFRFLVNALEPMYVAMDTTEIGGRDVIYDLRKNFEPLETPVENSKFVECDKNISIGVDMDGKDEMGPEHKHVNLKDWAVYYLQKVIYNGRLKALFDHKMVKQFNAIKSARKAGSHKSSYVSTIGVDHLHAAMIVFGYLAYLFENDKIEDNGVETGSSDGISFTLK